MALRTTMNLFPRNELPPLENPLVLELVFEHCTFKDLKACRQVSKVGRNSSLKAWRSSVQVVIGRIHEYRANIHKMSEFLEFVQNENSTHFESPFVTNYAVCEDSQRFWDLCGPSIKTLALYGMNFQSADVLRNVILQFCPNMEHLTLRVLTKVSENPTGVMEEPTEFVDHQFGEHKKLKSLAMEYAASTYDRRHSFSWMELLSYSPLLETLNLGGELTGFDELFRSFTLIREQHPQKLQLKYVRACSQFGYPIPGSIFPALQDSKLRLASLELLVPSLRDAEGVRDILRVHARSLKKLTLRGAGESAACFSSLSYGQLVNLQQLELHFFTLSMEFLKYTPNLRKLRLAGVDHILTDKIDTAETSDVKLTKSKELDIQSGASHLEFTGGFRILATWMPNLETLRIFGLRNEGFAAVCEHWPNLVSLTIRSSHVDDSGITGLDKVDIARINEEGETGTWRPVTAPRANITSLKRLQALYMTCLCVEPELGVCSALCGILQLSHLRNLTIERYVNMEIEPQNPKLWNAVRARLQL